MGEAVLRVQLQANVSPYVESNTSHYFKHITPSEQDSVNQLIMCCSEQPGKDEGNTSSSHQDVTQMAVADGTGGIHMCFQIKSFITNALKVRYYLDLWLVCFVGRPCGVKATSEKITCQETEGGAASLILLH